jgi:hypothetical protein
MIAALSHSDYEIAKYGEACNRLLSPVGGETGSNYFDNYLGSKKLYSLRL